VPGPDEQTARGEDVTVAAEGEVRRAPADVEMEKRLSGAAPRQRGTASLERQPRLGAGVVGGGDECGPESLADGRHEPGGVVAPGRETGEERPAAADVATAGADPAARQPVVDEAECGGEVEAVTEEWSEDERRTVGLARDRELHPAGDGVAADDRFGDERARCRRAEVEADDVDSRGSHHTGGPARVSSFGGPGK
jgi:hypothetical protein